MKFLYGIIILLASYIWNNGLLYTHMTWACQYNKKEKNRKKKCICWQCPYPKCEYYKYGERKTRK